MGLKSTKVKYVELPHTDATAVPKDVKKGKVFYNNDGRQVGEFSDAINIDVLKAVYGNDVKAITLNKNNMTNASNVFYYDAIKLSNMLFWQDIERTLGKHYVSKASAKYSGNIIGFEYKGRTALVGMSISYQAGNSSGTVDVDRSAFLIGSETTDIAIIQTKESIRSFWVSISDTCSEPITIFYE